MKGYIRKVDAEIGLELFNDAIETLKGGLEVEKDDSLLAQLDKIQNFLEYKKKGNELIEEKKIEEGLEYYKKALNTNIASHLIYSNRSAIYLKQKEYKLALEDADMSIKIKPEWNKGNNY
jgi:tetratricopeptide (TPR) repeat protein